VVDVTPEAKLAMVKAILRIDDTDTSEDALITTYLDMAQQEMLSWRYSHANPDNVPEAVPTEYEITQVQAVINGYTQAGVEGQVLSIENGIHRHFNYSDMVEYVRAHVIPIAGVMRSKSGTCPCSCGCGETADAGTTPSVSSDDSSIGEGANGDGDGA
jgi:hypothetical protein